MKRATSRNRPDSDAAVKNHRKFVLSILATSGAAQIAVLGPASPAQALCNGQPTNYAGQDGIDLVYNGLDRYISVPDSNLWFSAQHIAHWMGVSNYDYSLCPANSFHVCNTQVGHVIGVQTDAVHYIYNVYFEAVNAGGGYSYHNYAEYAPPVGSNKFYTVHNSAPPDGFGFYHFETNYGGNHPLMQGIMPWAVGAGEAISEMASSLPGQTCPTIGKNNTFVYFGTNGSGTATASTKLFKSTAVPNNWSEWTLNVVPYNNYEHDMIAYNSAFKNRGGNE